MNDFASSMYTCQPEKEEMKSIGAETTIEGSKEESYQSKILKEVKHKVFDSQKAKPSRQKVIKVSETLRECTELSN